MMHFVPQTNVPPSSSPSSSYLSSWTRRSPLLVLFTIVSVVTSSIEDANTCQSDKLAIYTVTFTTYWDSTTFPKQYPEWRPPAQWSKVVGFSHEEDFHLFQMGQESSEGLKEFAETGQTDNLDKIEDKAIFDGFNAPPIESGAGQSQAKIFVDGNHTLVSVISKIVPSPDWFVGLDSLNLCENGRFLDSVTIEADPMDAGTDNGFTFTSPNWPTVPQAVIFRITNTYPTHPAGSFHYPEISSLPTIATFSFVKEKEYELNEVFHLNHGSDGGEDVLNIRQVNKFAYSLAQIAKSEQKARDALDHRDSTNGSKSPRASSSPLTASELEVMNDEEDQGFEDDLDPDRDHEIEVDNDNDDDDEHEEEEEEEDPNEEVSQMLETNEIPQKRKSDRHHRRHHHRPNSLSNLGMHSVRRGGYHASSSPTDFLKKRYKSEFLESASEKVFDKDSLYKKILESYRASKKHGLSESLAKKLKRRRMRKLRKHSKRHHKPPRDCKVSEWSDWGPCSKSCGIGEALRRRTIQKHPKRGGKSCPKLEGVRWCGSARNCRDKYFDW
ncbi:hypothetical protein TCAL_08000 [Tigriopus californicus]|uniref:Spondin domain-containing protein n=1 Tax=Tigriopus californicus TaxID=6832 RepID=A0A553PGF0_TIGCA|nr:uncharacterized protein LOC131880571 [Tigriopus californicus]TRY76744.1 hypothetical protein TCAL_08000 [Tigriopus californicus]|eukprot:TCALIF_08000-PA protein Name:"Similar to Spon2 Spondin-2 (Rattus norvegicus)" AED:0.07 eAED:0.07 QI:268/1/1/1/0.83/0.85/7/324/552